MITVECKQKLVKTSYKSEDVTVLLKDLSNDMEPLATKEREELIQSGVHYSEMLPKEDSPTEEYMKLYRRAMNEKKLDIALAIAILSKMVIAKTTTPVIISLARAGTPVGILIKRFLKSEYGVDATHYSISIIRGKGIDENAMECIYNTEIIGNNKSVDDFIFVDGWTGKGMIQMQINEAVDKLIAKDEKWFGLDRQLYVIADPGNVTKKCATRKDYLLPSACLNSTISGLTSRTILNKYINTENGDFHGVVYIEHFKDIDESNNFIDEITEQFKNLDAFIMPDMEVVGASGMDIVKDICKHFDIQDFTKVKPGIGETTRVLLRRVPWKVLFNTTVNPKEDDDLKHILMLCKQKNIPYEFYNLGKNYKVCGIIKELSSDA